MSIIERLAAAVADRYRIERELGAGGMATVYLARVRQEELRETRGRLRDCAVRPEDRPASVYVRSIVSTPGVERDLELRVFSVCRYTERLEMDRAALDSLTVRMEAALR